MRFKTLPAASRSWVLGASAHYNWMFGMPVARGRRSSFSQHGLVLPELKIWHNGQRSPVAARRILHRRRRNWPLPARVLRCGPGRWWHRDFRTRPARGYRVSDARMVGRPLADGDRIPTDPAIPRRATLLGRSAPRAPPSFLPLRRQWPYSLAMNATANAGAGAERAAGLGAQASGDTVAGSVDRQAAT